MPYALMIRIFLPTRLFLSRNRCFWISFMFIMGGGFSGTGIVAMATFYSFSYVVFIFCLEVKVSFSFGKKLALLSLESVI